MSKNISEWITNLALDIYKVIQQYKAMPHFQEMVNKWAENREAEIDKLKTWNEQRRLHFEQTVVRDPRLQDEKAEPPEQGWQFENHLQHTEKKTESGWQRRHNIIHGWVPRELSNSIKPEITLLLPLSRDHELTLTEKYTVLAVVYDYGRKGTQEIPPWQWPGPDNWESPDALSSAKRSLFFESLCDDVSRLEPGEEGWLRGILDVVEEDVAKWADVQLPQRKEQKDRAVSETRFGRYVRVAKNNWFISLIILFIVGFIGVGTAVEKFDSIVALYHRVTGQQGKNQIQMERLEDKPIVTATATVEIAVRSEEQVNTRHPYQGAVLAFGKGKEALLLLSSKDSTAKQMGMAEVRYSSELYMKPTDKAFKQPLSLLEQFEYAQVRFDIIPPDSEVLSGTVICIFNNNIPIELSVPSQKMLGNLITIRHIDIGEALQQHTKSR